MLGTNDALRESNASSTVPGELLTIMQRIEAVQPGVTILLAPLPPIDPVVANATFGEGFLANADGIRDAINAQLPDIVAQAQALGIDAVFVPVSLSTTHLTDGVHLTEAGHAQLAAAWFAALSSNLATEFGTFSDAHTSISGVIDVNGSELGDMLRGDASANRLDGRGGADWIQGRGGNDILTGGIGGDTFVFMAPAEGVDSITDFTPADDLLQISAAGFGGGLVAGAVAPLVTATDAANVTSPAGLGTFIFDNQGASAGIVYWDPNGGSGADAAALVQLQNVTSLTASSLLIT
jgi:Ca2+-binding RTX toxin-like protein